MNPIQNKNLETATFGGGCFWCTEAIFQKLKGVKKVVSGYTGGTIANPTYQEVSSGNTGHVEAVQINFDPSVITFEQLLDIFWHTHNPTTLNQQGADIGTQYRSAIFYHTQEQKSAAINSMHQLEQSGEYQDEIVTQILPATDFYPAESYHQNYYLDNPNYPYCQIVIDPKLRKLVEKYSQLTK